jgi:hypothetical protein
VVLLEIYTAGGAPTGEVVACHGPDNGSLYVPGHLLAGFANGSKVVISLLRTQQVREPLPNGSLLDGITQMGILGTGQIVR